MPTTIPGSTQKVAGLWYDKGAVWHNVMHPEWGLLGTGADEHVAAQAMLDALHNAGGGFTVWPEPPSHAWNVPGLNWPSDVGGLMLVGGAPVLLGGAVPATGDNSARLATTAFVKAQGYLTSAPVTSFNGRTGAITPAANDYTFAQLGSKPTTLAGFGITDAAPLASPALTGTPTAPTPATGDSSTKLATTAFVKAQGYITSAPVTSFNSRTGAILPASGDYAIGQLGGVSIASPADGDVMTYEVATSLWKNKPGGGAGGAVSSVYGRTGAVVATAGDYTDLMIARSAPMMPLLTVADATNGVPEVVVSVGGTQQLAATQTDGWGVRAPSPSVTWASSDTSKATVDSSGLVTGVATGPVTITATVAGAPPVKIAGYVYVPIPVGTSWQTITNSNAAGTRFLGAAGTHSNQQTVPKTGNVYYLADGCVLDGTFTTNYCFLWQGVLLNNSVTIRGSGRWGRCGRIVRYTAGNATDTADNSKAAIYGASGSAGYTDGWVVDGIEIANCRARAIQMSQNWIVQRCWIHHIQDIGIADSALVGTPATYPMNGIIQDNLVEDINWQSNFPHGNGPAGIKLAVHSGALVRRNRVWRVNGEGIWFDIDCSRCTVGGAPGDGNYVADCWNNGVVYEICRYGEFSYNTVVGCGWRRNKPNGGAWGPSGEGRGVAFLISTSSDVAVHHNIVDATATPNWGMPTQATPRGAGGFTIFEENRAETVADATLWSDLGGTGAQTRKSRNNYIHHNVFVATSPLVYRAVCMSTTQTGGDVTSTTANNRLEANVYRVDGNCHWLFDATEITSFAAWQAARTTAGWALDPSPDAFADVRGPVVRARVQTESVEQYAPIPLAYGITAKGGMGASVTVDLSTDGPLVTGTLNAASCTITITNAYAGARLTLVLTQDATGSRAVVLPGKAPTVTASAANKVDKWVGDYTGSTWVWSVTQGL